MQTHEVPHLEERPAIGLLGSALQLGDCLRIAKPSQTEPQCALMQVGRVDAESERAAGLLIVKNSLDNLLVPVPKRTGIEMLLRNAVQRA